MFRLSPAAPPRPEVVITVDGVPLAARAGDNVAAALLAGGILACRTSPVGGEARGPYCLMGVCFDCLVTIDGSAQVQACLTPVRAGMAVALGSGRRRVAP